MNLHAAQLLAVRLTAPAFASTGGTVDLSSQ